MLKSSPRVALVLAMCALLGACRQDMHNQPKYRGLRASTFFADGSSARPLVEGTVARGTLQEDEAFFTGTAAEVTPIRELDNRVIGSGKRGPITTKLQEKFFDCVYGRDPKYAEWLTYV